MGDNCIVIASFKLRAPSRGEGETRERNGTARWSRAESRLTRFFSLLRFGAAGVRAGFPN